MVFLLLTIHIVSPPLCLHLLLAHFRGLSALGPSFPALGEVVNMAKDQCTFATNCIVSSSCSFRVEACH